MSCFRGVLFRYIQGGLIGRGARASNLLRRQALAASRAAVVAASALGIITIIYGPQVFRPTPTGAGPRSVVAGC